MGSADTTISRILPRVGLGVAALALLLAAIACDEKRSASAAAEGETPALRVSSYDPTRELYVELNSAFEKWYFETTGRRAKAQTDHGPSGKQGRDIAAGKEVDVAALAVDIDIDIIAKAGLIPRNWRQRYPNGSMPFGSAIAFMVRKGNPKNIKSWEDLARPDVVVVTPDPKTSGGARWSYVAAWCHALRQTKAAGKSDADAENAARQFTAAVYDEAVLDAGARGSSTRFVQQQTGDVLLQWESEVLQIVNDPASKGAYEVVLPADSVQIEVPIAVVDQIANKHGLSELADAYVKFHYSPQGQEILARRYLRPINPEVAARSAEKLPPLKTYRLQEHFADWPAVTKIHFVAGGELDRMRSRK